MYCNICKLLTPSVGLPVRFGLGNHRTLSKLCKKVRIARQSQHGEEVDPVQIPSSNYPMRVVVYNRQRLMNYARCLQEEEISRAVSERKRLARQLLSAENLSLTSRCTDSFHKLYCKYRTQGLPLLLHLIAAGIQLWQQMSFTALELIVPFHLRRYTQSQAAYLTNKQTGTEIHQ